MLRAAKICSQRDFLLLRFMWRTEVRVSEVINVTPNDIEYKNSVVNIRKAKGGRQRRVLFDQETLRMLSDYVLALNTPDPPVFPLSRAQVFNLVKRYGDTGGLKIHPRATPQLCNTFGTLRDGSNAFTAFIRAFQP
jgi:integrase/recombinase XerD